MLFIYCLYIFLSTMMAGAMVPEHHNTSRTHQRCFTMTLVTMFLCFLPATTVAQWSYSGPGVGCVDVLDPYTSGVRGNSSSGAAITITINDVPRVALTGPNCTVRGAFTIVFNMSAMRAAALAVAPTKPKNVSIAVRNGVRFEGIQDVGAAANTWPLRLPSMVVVLYTTIHVAAAGDGGVDDVASNGSFWPAIDVSIGGSDDDDSDNNNDTNSTFHNGGGSSSRSVSWTVSDVALTTALTTDFEWNAITFLTETAVVTRASTDTAHSIPRGSQIRLTNISIAFQRCQWRTPDALVSARLRAIYIPPSNPFALLHNDSALVVSGVQLRIFDAVDFSGLFVHVFLFFSDLNSPITLQGEAVVMARENYTNNGTTTVAENDRVRNTSTTHPPQILFERSAVTVAGLRDGSMSVSLYLFRSTGASLTIRDGAQFLIQGCHVTVMDSASYGLYLYLFVVFRTPILIENAYSQLLVSDSVVAATRSTSASRLQLLVFYVYGSPVTINETTTAATSTTTNTRSIASPTSVLNNKNNGSDALTCAPTMPILALSGVSAKAVDAHSGSSLSMHLFFATVGSLITLDHHYKYNDFSNDTEDSLPASRLVIQNGVVSATGSTSAAVSALLHVFFALQGSAVTLRGPRSQVIVHQNTVLFHQEASRPPPQTSVTSRRGRTYAAMMAAGDTAKEDKPEKESRQGTTTDSISAAQISQGSEQGSESTHSLYLVVFDQSALTLLDSATNDTNTTTTTTATTTNAQFLIQDNSVTALNGTSADRDVLELALFAAINAPLSLNGTSSQLLLVGSTVSAVNSSSGTRLTVYGYLKRYSTTQLENNAQIRFERNAIGLVHSHSQQHGVVHVCLVFTLADALTLHGSAQFAVALPVNISTTANNNTNNTTTATGSDDDGALQHHHRNTVAALHTREHGELLVGGVIVIAFPLALFDQAQILLEGLALWAEDIAASPLYSQPIEVLLFGIPAQYSASITLDLYDSARVRLSRRCSVGITRSTTSVPAPTDIHGAVHPWPLAVAFSVPITTLRNHSHVAIIDTCVAVTDSTINGRHHAQYANPQHVAVAFGRVVAIDGCNNTSTEGTAASVSGSSSSSINANSVVYNEETVVEVVIEAAEVVVKAEVAESPASAIEMLDDAAGSGSSSAEVVDLFSPNASSSTSTPSTLQEQPQEEDMMMLTATTTTTTLRLAKPPQCALVVINASTSAVAPCWHNNNNNNNNQPQQQPTYTTTTPVATGLYNPNLPAHAHFSVLISSHLPPCFLPPRPPMAPPVPDGPTRPPPPPPPPNTPPSDGDRRDGDNGGGFVSLRDRPGPLAAVIVGAAVGLVAAVASVTAAGYYCYHYYYRMPSDDDDSLGDSSCEKKQKEKQKMAAMRIHTTIGAAGGMPPVGSASDSSSVVVVEVGTEGGGGEWSSQQPSSVTVTTNTSTASSSLPQGIRTQQLLQEQSLHDQQQSSQQQEQHGDTVGVRRRANPSNASEEAGGAAPTIFLPPHSHNHNEPRDGEVCIEMVEHRQPKTSDDSDGDI